MTKAYRKRMHEVHEKLMFKEYSILKNAVLNYKTSLPPLLSDIHKISVEQECCPVEFTAQGSDFLTIQEKFPLTTKFSYVKLALSSNLSSRECRSLNTGIFFSGGPSPGGHNVIAGVLDAIKALSPKNRLFGFLNGGKGLIQNNYIEITPEMMSLYRNCGGFNLIGSGRTTIDVNVHGSSIIQFIKKLDLNALIIVGGDGSNTNTIVLAEYLLQKNISLSVIGVPKTIDGDLCHKFLDIPFGFDTATKFYSSIIGNISRDVLSSKTYYHFVKLMGRSASHVALECALQTHSNITLIGEEIANNQISLQTIIKTIVKIIKQRAAIGKFYGMVIIPEGIIEFIPEIINLVKDIEKNSPVSYENLSTALTTKSWQLLSTFPKKIADQLLFDRDVYGNVWLANISVEEFFIDLVKKELEQDNFKIPFNAVSHYLGYEGRSGLPTKFDNDYCYALGFTSVGLAKNNLTGYLATINNLHQPIEQWQGYGIPITAMLGLVKNYRNDSSFPLIQKHLVTMSSPAFVAFTYYRKLWQIEDAYRFIGPMQWNLPETLSSPCIPVTLGIKECSKYKNNPLYS